MPSSISNSNDITASHRAPTGPWLRTWGTAIVLAAVILAGYEALLRKYGHRPSIVDDINLWAYYRGKAANNDPQTVVLLGASRIQMGFHSQTFQHAFPDHTLINLAINGTSPIATLKDLAQDEKFRGLVICSIFAKNCMTIQHDMQQEYVDHYHFKASVNAQLNCLIASFFQSRLAMINPHLQLVKSLSRSIGTKTWPQPLYQIMLSDRSRLADYELIDIEEHRQWREDTLRQSYEGFSVPSPAQWLVEASVVEPWVQQIKRRGGDVVFVRFPMAHGYGALIDQTFPKPLYWDRFAAFTSAKTIHYQDYPFLSQFDCPDGSHIDQRDIPEFTRALLDELASQGLLPRINN